MSKNPHRTTMTKGQSRKARFCLLSGLGMQLLRCNSSRESSTRPSTPRWWHEGNLRNKKSFSRSGSHWMCTFHGSKLMQDPQYVSRPIFLSLIQLTLASRKCMRSTWNCIRNFSLAHVCPRIRPGCLILCTSRMSADAVKRMDDRDFYVWTAFLSWWPLQLISLPCQLKGVTAKMSLSLSIIGHTLVVS